MGEREVLDHEQIQLLINWGHKAGTKGTSNLCLESAETQPS